MKWLLGIAGIAGALAIGTVVASFMGEASEKLRIELSTVAFVSLLVVGYVLIVRSQEAVELAKAAQETADPRVFAQPRMLELTPISPAGSYATQPMWVTAFIPKGARGKIRVTCPGSFIVGGIERGVSSAWEQSSASVVESQVNGEGFCDLGRIVLKVDARPETSSVVTLQFIPDDPKSANSVEERVPIDLFG